MKSVHLRLIVAALFGLAAFMAAIVLHAPAPARGLIGWNVAAIIYLAMMWWLILTSDETQVRERAAAMDERRGVIVAIVVCAVIASLGAIVSAMLSVKHLPVGQQGAVAALAVLTLVSSWFVLHSLFAMHYAHEHFRGVALRGDKCGIIFPGDPGRTYLDFVYVALCVGATAQVSDPGVGTTRLRNLVTTHAVLSFFFNTAVLALGINILASLMSG